MRDLSLSLGQAVATLVVDVFALRLLKSGRAVYSKYKFLPTPTYLGTSPPRHGYLLLLLMMLLMMINGCGLVWCG